MPEALLDHTWLSVPWLNEFPHEMQLDMRYFQNVLIVSRKFSQTKCTQCLNNVWSRCSTGVMSWHFCLLTLYFKHCSFECIMYIYQYNHVLCITNIIAIANYAESIYKVLPLVTLECPDQDFHLNTLTMKVLSRYWDSCKFLLKMSGCT